MSGDASEDVRSDWSHDGDGWSVTVYGNCPVQGEGSVDGHPFYFRARGEGWSFSAVVEGDPLDVWIGAWRDSDKPGSGWFACGPYGDRFEAGWMSDEDSKKIVLACVAAVRASRAPGPGEVISLEVGGVPTVPSWRAASSP